MMEESISLSLHIDYLERNLKGKNAEIIGNL